MKRKYWYSFITASRCIWPYDFVETTMQKAFGKGKFLIITIIIIFCNCNCNLCTWSYFILFLFKIKNICHLILIHNHNFKVQIENGERDVTMVHFISSFLVAWGKFASLSNSYTVVSESFYSQIDCYSQPFLFIINRFIIVFVQIGRTQRDIRNIFHFICSV